MNAERLRAVQTLFDSLVDLHPRSRLDALNEARARDPGIVSEVEMLLEAHDASAIFIERPAYESAGVLFEDALDREARTMPEGARIGRYRVVREIGRGGMGEVYLAERDDAQFDQRVAIKVVKRGMDTDEILARFLAERQTLANLQHPNITRVLDGGATDDGRPYLVMEHIEGLPIDRHCVEKRLAVRARLELFCAVCDAVHAAHTALVVHRDLKPSNILVDADGAPKLLDFGVAKMLSPVDAPDDAHTVADKRMLTPQYASPEQLRGQPVTTATDVYSLGLILCVMLTGSRPFAERGPGALRFATIEAEARDRPTKPSALALRDPDDNPKEPREKLSRALKGDIDTVVLKALRVEPDQRYASAREFAEDIRLHLRGQPVRARPQTAAYTVSKFVRRRPWETALVASTAAALIVALGVSLLSLRESESAREREREQRRVAERSADESRAIVGFMEGIFSSIDPARARGRDTTLLREALDEAVVRLELEPGLSHAAEVSLRSTLGGTYRAISEYEQAERQLETALARALETHGELAIETARAWRQLGDLRQDQSRHRDAEAALLRGIEALDGAPEHEPGQREEERRRMLASLAIARMELGEFAFAEQTLRDLISSESSDDADPETDPRSLLPVVIAQQGRYDEAETLLRERLSTLTAMHGDDHPSVLPVMNSLAVILRRVDRTEEAIDLYARAGASAARVYGPVHRNTLAIRRNAAIAQEAIGRIDDAREEFREVFEAQRSTFGMEHADTISTAANYAQLLSNLGWHAEAEALYRAAYDAETSARGERTTTAGILLGGLGACLNTQGRHDEAEGSLLRSREIFLANHGPEHPLTKTTVRFLRTLYGPEGIDDPERLEALGADDAS